MALLDFRLKYLQQKVASPTDERIHVLLQFDGKLPDLTEAGFRVTSTAGNIAAGYLPLNRLEQLKERSDIIFIEASPSFKGEMDKSLAEMKLLDTKTRQPVIPGYGKGAIIGIIDSSFDLTHPCFLDSQGKTRILAAWDQEGRDGTPPAAPLGYGVEYTPDMINGRLGHDTPMLITNDKEAEEHGTFVAGIAAGNGYPDGNIKGVAPEAELIFVSYRNDMPLGGSAFVLDAITYIVNHARRLGKPVVINLSQGDNLGAHDGTSLLERAIDYFVEQGDVLIVNSAGNEREGRRHAHGKAIAGQYVALSFSLDSQNDNEIDGDTIDIWYHKADRLAIALQTPEGFLSQFVQPDTEATITFPLDIRAYVCSVTNHPCNGDNRISIIFEKGNEWIKDVEWKLVLHGNEVEHGDFDVWADCAGRTTPIIFAKAHVSDDCTITLPGTARHILSVGAFVSRPMPPVGILAPLSSVGLTRDGRPKPEMTAPGFNIKAPGTHKTSGNNPGGYALRHGTSAAAPHVSGLIALLWALRPKLTSQQISLLLRLTAGTDTFTGATHNPSWGHGKVNAGLAYEALSIFMKGE
jgi:subtilisin family serine protease